MRKFKHLDSGNIVKTDDVAFIEQVLLRQDYEEIREEEKPKRAPRTKKKED